ncbi:HAD family hydrolase [Kribbella solani]|uniref:FMN phosphatase YigB (HAD superfamily) n=1 Tax=Kribbella solani TaxID=236067 RepID=A0A841DGK4_9ACTN|nr:HAD family hydrolase [Kribbella solani]MBB5978254.1 FMN phosphatase YigB (HAD superfamily) [Kribbella solani]
MDRLVCFDLDNTLIDRDGAFRSWARWWTNRAGFGTDAADWLVAHDNGGYRPRAELFADFEQRFGAAISVDDYHRDHPTFTWADDAVLTGLAALRSAGWRLAVVTNGTVIQQTGKLTQTGIADVVDYCCISEAVGVRKPDPRIFAVAAQGAGATLGGGWMVGDHPAYDTAGGQAAGLKTIQVGSHHPEPPADHHVPSILEAFPLIR